MSFESFELSQIDVGEVTLRVRHGGAGPPLLLLHGYPETHMMWWAVADELAKDFTVIAPDLRGYGKSTPPADSDDHETYSKRAMARDAIALMRHFGFERFDIASHDRGARVGYRLALDQPAAVRKLTVMDIVPTGEAWARADWRFALGYWHWSFLAQPNAEALIRPDPELFFFHAQFRSIVKTFEPYADYLACAKDPSVIHAMCEDYRAGATYDRLADEADRAAGRTIACPVQALWGAKGALPAWYDTLEVWKPWAPDLRGQALDCGHFLPEEKPAETLSALRSFHGA